MRITNALTSSTEYTFDDDAANRAVNFFTKLLRHTKGQWAGAPFELDAWQRDHVIRPLFGWKKADGLRRRFETAYIEIPRKNGKSTLAAGIALYLLFADGEMGAEVYSAANDREQARIVFQQARDMCELSHRLFKRALTYKNSIVIPKTRSSYKVLSSEAYTKDGLNASGIVFDELHAQPSRDLWDVLTTSTGARSQPLTVAITTAGHNHESICWEQREYARQVAENVIPDPSYFAFISGADESDDWTDPAVWAAANPGYGITVRPDYLEKQFRKAEAVPAYQNTFRRLHLNQWTSQERRWLDMEYWDKCGASIPDLSGRPCVGGLDLASTTDIAAFSLVFPPISDNEPFYVQPYFWIPGDNMRERSRRDRVPYDAWVRDGLVTATEGNVIDYGYIEKKIGELGQQYHIREIAFDRWGAGLISQNLTGAGFTMVQFGQGFASMSAPTKELLRLVLGVGIVHGSNPVLRWMADNLAVDMDAAGNIKPNKRKSREKIDGMVALIMGLARACAHEGQSMPSVYEDRGIRTV